MCKSRWRQKCPALGFVINSFTTEKALFSIILTLSQNLSLSQIGLQLNNRVKYHRIHFMSVWGIAMKKAV